MKPSLYLETSIISYLAALPSRDLIVAAHQQITHEWWSQRREMYDLFVSDLVIQEVRRGDTSAAERRMDVLRGLKRLVINGQVRSLVKDFIQECCLPARAKEDTVHVALAAVHGMDYLLTWNCKHIANSLTRQKVTDSCRSHGLKAPIISTPEELPEEE
ncbi:MAG: type II toxin-antitoxin system VapC family toxin [Magnetococcales bacterium]|nr:type II toxin-antitoxin system VapC family toxin [Magnetococcales bacterium]